MSALSFFLRAPVFFVVRAPSPEEFLFLCPLSFSFFSVGTLPLSSSQIIAGETSTDPPLRRYQYGAPASSALTSWRPEDARIVLDLMRRVLSTRAHAAQILSSNDAPPPVSSFRCA